MFKNQRQLVIVTRLFFLFNCLLFITFSYQKSIAQVKPVSSVKAKVDTSYYYYDDSTLKAKGILHGDDKSGMWTYYYPDGGLDAIENYVNGELNGNYISYYENGKIYKKGGYKNDKLNGPLLENYESGKIHYKSNYLNGEYNGLLQEYFESGKLSVTMSFLKGKKHGAYVSYYENGIVATKGTYNNGQKVGVWYEYDEKGKLTSKENNGVYVPVTVNSYSGSYSGLNGQIKLLILPNGNWIFYGLRSTLSGYYTKSISGASFTLNLYRNATRSESMYYGSDEGFLLFSVSGNVKSREVKLSLEAQQSGNSMLPLSDSYYWLSK